MSYKNDSFPQRVQYLEVPYKGQEKPDLHPAINGEVILDMVNVRFYKVKVPYLIPKKFFDRMTQLLNSMAKINGSSHFVLDYDKENYVIVDSIRFDLLDINLEKYISIFEDGIKNDEFYVTPVTTWDSLSGSLEKYSLSFVNFGSETIDTIQEKKLNEIYSSLKIQNKEVFTKYVGSGIHIVFVKQISPEYKNTDVKYLLSSDRVGE